MIQYIFYYSDLFKKPVNLLFSSKQNKSSILGSLLSIGIMIFLIYNVAISDVFRKEKPEIIIQSVADEIRPALYFGKQNFSSFGIRIDDYDENVYNDSTYIQVYSLYYQMKVNTGEYQINDVQLMKNCQPSDFMNPNTLAHLNLFNAFCMNDPNFLLKGFWDTEYISYLKIELRFCNNETMNGTCKSMEEIKNWVRNKNFNIYFPDMNYNLNQYDNFSKISYSNKYHLMDSNVKKSQTFFFKRVQMNSDDGFFFENIKPYYSYMFDYESSDFRMDNSEGVISEFYFYVSLDTHLMIRRYQKIQTVLANFGGIANFLFICGYILVSSYQEFSLTKLVMNKIYSFSDIHKNRKKRKKKTKEPSLLFPFNKEIPKNNSVSELINALPNLEISNKFPEKAKMPIKKSETQPMDISLNITPHLYSERKNPCPPPKDCPEQNDNDIKQESEDFEKDTSNNPINLKNELNNKVNSFFEITPIPLDLSGDLNKNKKIVKSRFSKKFIKPNDAIDNHFIEFEKNKKKENKLDLSFTGYIYGLFKSIFKKDPSPSFKLFSKAQRIFVEEIDLLEILVKLKEFEKFKSIMLSEDQLKLFQAVGKPLISLNESEEDSFQLKMSKLIFESKKVNENEILNIYKKLKMQKDNNSEINKRLLALLDEKMKEYKEMNKLEQKSMMDS